MYFLDLNGSDSEIADSFKALYAGAFPKEERKPLPILWLLKKLGRIDTLALMHEDEFAGFVILGKTKRFVFIDYLAIDPSMRGKGLGSAVLEKIQEKYPNQTIVLEVESPIESEENYHQRIRRIDFYKRNGFRKTDLRVLNNDCDFTILAMNGKLTFSDYQELYHKIYGRFVTRRARLEKLPLQTT